MLSFVTNTMLTMMTTSSVFCLRCQTVYYGGKLFGFSHSSDWRGLSATKRRGEIWEANQPMHTQHLLKSWELWSWQFGNTPSLPLDQAVLQTNSCPSFPFEKQRELGLDLSKFLQLWYLPGEPTTEASGEAWTPRQMEFVSLKQNAWCTFDTTSSESVED